MRQSLFFVVCVVGSLALTSCGGESQTAPTVKMLANVTNVSSATFSGARTNYSINKTATGYQVVNLSGTIISTSLTSNIETLKFSDVIVNLGIGAKAQTIVPSDLKILVELYIAFFNRVPDADGLSYWIDQYKNGLSIDQIADSFYVAAVQYTSLTGYSTTMNAADFVKVIYKNVLGRSGQTAPPEADVQYWAGELTSNRASKGELVKTMLHSAHSFAGDETWGWVSGLLNNKYTVGKHFAVEQGLNYITPEESISKTMAIAAAVTANDMTSALRLASANKPVDTFTTSYDNAKAYGLSRIAFPGTSGVLGNGSPLAWAASDFFGLGSVGIFTANQNYGPWAQTESVAQSDPKYFSDFEFWHIGADKSFVKLFSAKGCLHPRKGVVADFNQDKVPDVFVACHGYDDVPFPGEKSKLVLSNGRGGYKITDATDAGFFHGAAAADIDGDGFPDIVVADNKKNPNVYFLMNQKDGTFKLDTTRITGIDQQGPYFSTELLDIDGDGFVDLIIGGHEGPNSPTKILYGNALGKFGADKVTVIPPVVGRGVIADFTFVTNGGIKGLYISRSGDGTGDAGFYGSRTLQFVNMSTLASKVILDSKSYWGDGAWVNAWLPWWLPVTQNGSNGVAPYDNQIGNFFAN